jgi:Ca-activated chloride channel family protein
MPALLLILLSALQALAVTTGQIRGSVADEDGLPIPGVSLVLTSAVPQGEQHTQSDATGSFLFAALPPGSYDLRATHPGFQTVQHTGLIVNIDRTTVVGVALPMTGGVEELVVAESRRRSIGDVLTPDFLQRIPSGRDYQSAVQAVPGVAYGNPNLGGASTAQAQGAPAAFLAPPPAVLMEATTSEEYTDYGVNGFTVVSQDSLSTFSIDVDTASYTVARRKLQEGGLPPVASVRVEEFVNYFDYDYPQPTGKHPFNVQFEAFPDPFRAGRHIMRVGVQGKDLSRAERPPLHLTFLVDVSGSMSSSDKLGLAKQSLHMLVDTLSEGDTVALATYAGRTAEVLPPTDSANKRKIHDAIEALSSGGSTAMSSGIDIAYKLAQRSFETGAENRVIVMSDGDANVGSTSWDEMLSQIKGHADAGVTLSTIGFGMGNYRDTLMEQLANNGDGNNYYIDSQAQAQRVFVEQMGSTVFTIARDVKLQVAFNEASVAAYRLIGYENRDIADRDFRNDRVDAGEVGAGHTVTALYEVILKEGYDDTLATLNLRYEAPGADKAATEIAFPFPDDALSETEALTSRDARIAYAAATFAEILRQSPHASELSMDRLIAYTQAAKRPGKDDAELIDLMKAAQRLGAGAGSGVAAR